jgi:GNAT superfamily N-acetyltransferase
MMQSSKQIRKMEALISGMPVQETMAIRPLRADDVDDLLTMHPRLSAQTIYNRYLRPYTPTWADFGAICNLAASRGAGFAVVTDTPPSHIVGIGYYMIDEKRPSVAEPAVLIEDRYQGMGLGSWLFARLTEYARSYHITAFTMLVEADNRPMLRLLDHSGYQYKTTLDYGACDVWMPLQVSKTK